jgi:hypothetical protein
MVRRTTVGFGVLFALTAWLGVAPVLAQAPQASPAAQDKAAGSAKKAGDPGAKPDKGERNAPKGDDRPTKTDETQAKTDNKDNPAGAEKKDPDDSKLKERLQRRRHQQDTEQGKIAAALHGQPMTEAMHQELKRHARRLARLERIKALALEAKDTAVVERVNKLIDKENARHDKFTTHADEKDDKGKDDKGKDDKGGAK